MLIEADADLQMTAAPDAADNLRGLITDIFLIREQDHLHFRTFMALGWIRKSKR